LPLVAVLKALDLQPLALLLLWVLKLLVLFSNSLLAVLVPALALSSLSSVLVQLSDWQAVLL
jgi:hypothetical protein